MTPFDYCALSLILSLGVGMLRAVVDWERIERDRAREFMRSYDRYLRMRAHLRSAP